MIVMIIFLHTGMGELHLEVIRDRIHKEFKVDAELGPLQVAYRETCTITSSYKLEVDKTIGEAPLAVHNLLFFYRYLQES